MQKDIALMGGKVKSPRQFFNVYMAAREQIERLVSGIAPPKEVEDIVQETYVRLCQVEGKKTIRYPRAYMLRTAKNLALDYIKRAESRLTTGMDIDELTDSDFQPVSELDPTYNLAVSAQEFALLCEAVRSLPRQCRRAFVLKKVYGYTQKEIMAEMGLGQATVETHIVNGTKKCVKYMRAQQEGHSPLESEFPPLTNTHKPSKQKRGDAL